MLKRVLTLLLFTFITLFAADARLNNYPEAQEWLQEADTEGYAAFNIGVLYHKTVKDNDKAIEWYEKAYAMPDKVSAASAASNLGYLYDDAKEYDEAIVWYKRAIEKENKSALFNLALLYDVKLKQPKKAIVYYEKAYKLGNKSAPLSIGVIYKNIFHDSKNAISWYKKAYGMGNMGGAHNLALLYKNTLNKMPEAIQWYEKAVKGGYADSINNLGNLYHDQGDNVKGAAYIFAMANYGYSKDEVLDYLKNEWKLDRETLQKAYELQKTLDIPKHYTGGID